MRTHLALIPLLLAGPAHADGGVGVVVTGDATIQPQLAAQLEGWLRAQGHQLVPSPVPAEALSTLIDCFVIEDLACARGVVEAQATTEMLVFAKVEVSDADNGMRDISLAVHWFDRGTDPVSHRRTCEGCTDAALRSTADEIMTALAATGSKDVGTLQLTSIPSGARVVIDGKPAGVTPLILAIAPGEHTIAIVHADHLEATRTVTIRKAASTPVDVRLEPKATPSKTLPLALLAGGGALLAAGMIAYAISEDDTGQTYEYRDTTALGIGLGVTGLAAIGVGAYLYLRKAPAESAPSVAVLPGGAVVGWARSF